MLPVTLPVTLPVLQALPPIIANSEKSKMKVLLIDLENCQIMLNL